MGAAIPDVADAFWHGVASTAFPIITANSTWIGSAAGAPGAGTSTTWANAAGVPNDPTRTTAKPVLHWWQPSQLRGVGNVTIGVIADARDGISSVTFGGDIPDTPGVFSYYVDTDINNKTRIRPFWGVTIDCATAAAAHGQGTGSALRIYAEAVANNNAGAGRTYQARIIGPLLIYPRTVQYDWDVTLNPGGSNTGSATASGGNYLTLDAALQGMHNAITPVASGGGGFECGRIKITSAAGDVSGRPGFYDWKTGGHTANGSGPYSLGLSCVEVAAGINATIIRGTSFVSSGPNGYQAYAEPWRMFVPVDNFEFRGGGLTIDRQYFMYINTGSGFNTGAYAPYNLHPLSGAQLSTSLVVLNGCTLTNGIGTAVHYYWNGGQAPALTISGYSVTDNVCWAHDCTINYQPKGAGIFNWAFCNSVNSSFSTSHYPQGPTLVYGEYYANATLATEQIVDFPRNSFSVTYTGAGTSPTAAYDSNNLFTLSVNSTTAKSFTLLPGTSPLGDGTNTFSLPSQIVNYINNTPAMTSSGWSATLIDTTDNFSAYQMNGGSTGVVGGENKFSYPLTSGVAQTITTSAVQHSEWIHVYGAGLSNILIWNCTINNCGFGTSFLNNETGAGPWQDVSIKNITFNPQGASGTTRSFHFGQHVCYENITAQEPFTIAQGTGHADSYSSFSQVITPDITPDTGSWTAVNPTNSVVGGANPPSGNGNATPFGSNAWTDAQFASLFSNRNGCDLRPSAALQAYTFAPINPRDAEMTVRAANDVAGAWSVNATAPSWPF